MNLISQINTIINKNFLALFLTSLFLIKIPPFYIFYPVPHSLLTTHSLTRLIILVLFIYVAFNTLLGKIKIASKKTKPLIILFLIYFFFQSISILGASNIASFLQRYKDIVFPGLFLFITLYVRQYTKAIIYVFIASLIFNFIYQSIMLLFPGFFRHFGELLVYKSHFELVNINLQRSRLFIETYDEITLPLLFILIVSAKGKLQLFLMSLFALIALPSFLSNFRSRILMLALAFLSTFIFLGKKGLLLKSGLVFFFLIIGYLTYSILNNFFGFSFVDRFAFADKKEDVLTAQSRLSNILVSMEIGIASPIFGVGLGNYYDHLPASKKTRLSLFNWKNKESEIASTNPHNIFAQILSETGFISLIFYITMIIYFLIIDIPKLFKDKTGKTPAFIIAFWTLFSYSLFNPTTTLTYNLLFWTLRALI